MTRNETIIQRHSDGAALSDMASEFELSVTRVRRIVTGAGPLTELPGSAAAIASAQEPSSWQRGIAEAFHRDFEYMAEGRAARIARRVAR